MKKICALEKALAQAFWLTYPRLTESHDYSLRDLFPELVKAVPHSQIDDYEKSFHSMIDSGELPLIPVIPLQRGMEVSQFALDFR